VTSFTDCEVVNGLEYLNVALFRINLEGNDSVQTDTFICSGTFLNQRDNRSPKPLWLTCPREPWLPYFFSIPYGNRSERSFLQRKGSESESLKLSSMALTRGMQKRFRRRCASAVRLNESPREQYKSGKSSGCLDWLDRIMTNTLALKWLGKRMVPGTLQDGELPVWGQERQ
jgi:hypothetical protein